MRLKGRERKSIVTFCGLLILLLAVSVLLFYFSPWLIQNILLWQREFNQSIAAALPQIRQNSLYAGGTLMLISFLYGLLHALGPGHGKFVIAAYLTAQPSQLKSGVGLSFLSALLQGVTAVLLTSVIVVALNLSSAYFHGTQLWLERIAFLFLLWLGWYWCRQSINSLWRKPIVAMNIRSIRKADSAKFVPLPRQSAVKISTVSQGASCSCGGEHIYQHMQRARQDRRSQWLTILTIAMRPCSGAVFVLFFSYMLGLYGWGIAAALCMALGTGITLSLFALLVRFARNSALRVSRWYFSPAIATQTGGIIRFVLGISLMVIALGLLYTTTLQTTGGRILFGG
ncbi:ABC-type nickel/cobalt efflux system permease component RcnA [Mesocricetibacter intestinalis]|uniref:Nickel/cobalt efflux system n=1 Tax=Mesocricetibacter intestinalis TaxID=1521930 RepID=A0A4V3D9J1_9PAST|nr:zinc transporter permease subunit ZevB [Mesocricetibacter intestinalis]TDQ57218.1 ABC-type nickel/cobalt efflux system permease component RcnA [Mesocricetibacter intestinalis]